MRVAFRSPKFFARPGLYVKVFGRWRRVLPWVMP